MNKYEKQVNTAIPPLHQCPECGLKYKEKEWAEKCEAWCREHKSCNLEIIAHAEKEETS